MEEPQGEYNLRGSLQNSLLVGEKKAKALRERHSLGADKGEEKKNQRFKSHMVKENKNPPSTTSSSSSRNPLMKPCLTA